MSGKSRDFDQAATQQRHDQKVKTTKQQQPAKQKPQHQQGKRGQR